jgi:hypothetical protein
LMSWWEHIPWGLSILSHGGETIMVNLLLYKSLKAGKLEPGLNLYD